MILFNSYDNDINYWIYEFSWNNLNDWIKEIIDLFKSYYNHWYKFNNLKLDIIKYDQKKYFYYLNNDNNLIQFYTIDNWKINFDHLIKTSDYKKYWINIKTKKINF